MNSKQKFRYFLGLIVTGLLGVPISIFQYHKMDAWGTLAYIASAIFAIQFIIGTTGLLYLWRKKRKAAESVD